MIRKKKKGIRHLNQISFTEILCYSIMVIVCLTIILPFVHEFAKSFSHPFEVDTGHVLFLPKHFTYGNYEFFFVKNVVPLTRALQNTFFLVIVGGTLSVLSILIFSFPLSRPWREFRIGSVIIYVIVFCMIVQRPIIPLRITFQNLGLLDSLWAIVLNMLIDPFMVILTITFFKNIPEELFDAAKVDGANEFTTFIRIVMPLCVPIIATIFLIQSIGYWNSFFQAKLLIITPEKLPIQNYVAEIMRSGMGETDVDYIRDPFGNSTSIRSALLMITTIIPTVIYLSLQKYFKPGFASGAIKG